MRRGTCVKCGAQRVRAAANGVKLGDLAHAALQPHAPADFRGIIRLKQTDVWSFACAACGYLEMYLYDPEALAYIDQQWIPVPPTS